MAEKVIRGKIYGVAGPTVIASGMEEAKMHTVCLVGREKLLGEIIRIKGGLATLQVYEDTSGLGLDEEVVSHSKPLTVTLGPGLLTNIFDGTQRPLYQIKATGTDYIERGISLAPLDLDKEWEFSPEKSAGDIVAQGDVLGSIPETKRITHKVMVPPGVKGTIKKICKDKVSGRGPVAILDDNSEIGLFQEWPVRSPRPYAEKLPPIVPFMTGQRIFDTLLPVAEGGTAIVPGGFGTGKTVVEHTISKHARTDIVIYIGCGERGNEMTEMLTDFPGLVDETGMPLSLRTVIIVNTSNMPVAAREASIFTGITIAEYFRDMGYSVALLADSISRWAEALREISARLEEMPGEEGFPPYLASQLGFFYERSGRVLALGGNGRKGSITIISAVSPPGGDFSEPVTQAALRFAGAFWALDPELAYRRHFPAVNWKISFSLYYDGLGGWYKKEVSPEMDELRSRLITLLQKDAELKEVVQIIGMEALQESDRLTLETAAIANDAFLKQSAYSKVDAFNSYEKQFWMLKAIFSYYDSAGAALKRGIFIERVIGGALRAKLLNMQDTPDENFSAYAKELISSMEYEFATIENY